MAFKIIRNDITSLAAHARLDDKEKIAMLAFELAVCVERKL